MPSYVVQLQPPPAECWLAPWEGDPGRTCVAANARRWGSHSGAKRALTAARAYSPFRDAKVVKVVSADARM